MARVLIIDNFDSYTYNLYQYTGAILAETERDPYLIVRRNNDITLPEIISGNFDHIIISPGPGHPGDPRSFGVCHDVITKLADGIPILGVCLGMQGIAHSFGATIIRAKEPMHGKTSEIDHDGRGIFTGLRNHLNVMRYHSLIIEPATLPDCFEISSVASSSSEIMGIRHKSLLLEGIQFHPESFATQYGTEMIANFLR